MRTAFLLVMLLGMGQATAGCTGAQDACTRIGCLDGVSVVLTGLATKVAAQLPVTVKVCAGSSCRSFRIDHTSAAPTCTSVDGGTTQCSIDGMGTVVLTTLPLPAGTTGGATVAVHATVTDKKGTALFDSTVMTTITQSQPNGPGCDPICHGAQVAFAP